MSYKLHTDPGNFRAFKALIAAEYVGVSLEVLAPSASSPSKLPALELPSGEFITGSNTIARFVSRLRSDLYSSLNGNGLIQSAQIDSWLELSSHEIELPATIWFYPVLGYIPSNAAAIAQSKKDLAAVLGVLEAHLSDKTFLVGDAITLADIAIVSALVYPFKFVADKAFRAPFPNVLRWFDTLVHQPQFEAVIGTVVLAEKELTVSGSAATVVPAGNKQAASKKDDKPKEKKPKEEKPKVEKVKVEKPKEEKPKEEKKPKKKNDDDDDEPEPDYVEPKKEEHPFKLLDKSNPTPFVMVV